MRRLTIFSWMRSRAGDKCVNKSCTGNLELKVGLRSGVEYLLLVCNCDSSHFRFANESEVKSYNHEHTTDLPFRK